MAKPDFTACADPGGPFHLNGRPSSAFELEFERRAAEGEGGQYLLECFRDAVQRGDRPDPVIVDWIARAIDEHLGAEGVPLDKALLLRARRGRPKKAADRAERSKLARAVAQLRYDGKSREKAIAEVAKVFRVSERKVTRAVEARVGLMSAGEMFDVVARLLGRRSPDKK